MKNGDFSISSRVFCCHKAVCEGICLDSVLSRGVKKVLPPDIFASR